MVFSDILFKKNVVFMLECEPNSWFGFFTQFSFVVRLVTRALLVGRRCFAADSAMLRCGERHGKVT